MWPYILKILLSAFILVAVAEVAKRNSFGGAVIASLPLTSLLALVWLYIDTGDIQKIADLSQGIFWLVLPSLALFITLPLLLRVGLGFWVSLMIACITTLFTYFGMMKILNMIGVRV